MGTGPYHTVGETAEDAGQRVGGTADEAARQGESAWEYIKETVTGAPHKASKTAEDVQRRTQAWPLPARFVGCTSASCTIRRNWSWHLSSRVVSHLPPPPDLVLPSCTLTTSVPTCTLVATVVQGRESPPMQLFVPPASLLGPIPECGGIPWLNSSVCWIFSVLEQQWSKHT